MLSEQPELVTRLSGLPAIRAYWQLAVRERLNRTRSSVVRGELKSELSPDQQVLRDLNETLRNYPNELYRLGSSFLRAYPTPATRAQLNGIPDYAETREAIGRAYKFN